MMLRPEHEPLVRSLIDQCKKELSVIRWWQIGEQMHTLTDDYKILYDYPSAKPELDRMWEVWLSADPRPKKVQP
jgi:hypothetical protein